MNATLRAQRAYAPGATPMRTPKHTEYDVIARVTYGLKMAAETGTSDFSKLAQALEQNRKLWQIFATEVASHGNLLPEALRAQIFYLAEFTFQHTREVLARRADVSELIDVNKAIMRGLKPGAA